MNKKSDKMYTQIVKLTRTALILFFLTILLFISFINHQEYKNSSPYDVVVSDIKANSVNISWKTLKNVPTYVKINKEKTPYGDGEPSIFHTVRIDNLEQLTEYQFHITDGNREWKKAILPDSKSIKSISRSEFYFITSKLQEQIELPQLLEIESNSNELVYISLQNSLTGMNSKVKSIRTNEYGNALVDKNSFNLDWKEDSYSVNIYPALKSDSRISKYITVNASEINCNLNAPKQTIDGVTREQFANYATRWVDGRGKNYAYECFNDVVYRSRMAGVDPAFTLAVWLNESSASNYTQNLKQYGHIEDFGIHGLSSVPPQNFNAQITHFLKMSHRNSCPGLTAWESWGNIYRFGTCNAKDPNQRSSGIDYYKKTENLYRWITNGKKLPEVVTGLPIPVDIGHDLGNWNPLAKPICCVAQFAEKDKQTGLYSEDILESTCEDIWGPKNQNITKYIQIENIDKKECEIEFESSCCKLGNEILWYPTKYCPYVINDFNNLKQCEESTQEKACFFRDTRFQWLPKGIGEDNVININSEIQCNLRNDVSIHSITINKGVNFIGFDFTPSFNNDVLYASRLMSMYPQISLIGSFTDNEWSPLISKSESNPFSGQDFYFEQSKGYLIISDEEIDIDIFGWNNSEGLLPDLQKGWNFVHSGSITNQLSIPKLSVDKMAVWSNEKESFVFGIDNQYEDVLGVQTKESKYQAVFILNK